MFEDCHCTKFRAPETPSNLFQVKYEITTTFLQYRRFNDPAVIDSLKLYYIQDARPKFDVIMLQEHKLRGEALARLGTSLWRHAKFWGVEASPGYGNDPNQEGAWCGGIATFLAPQSNLITQEGKNFDNKVHWIVLKGLPGGDIGIANIYAHNDSTSCCALWEAMAQELPRTARWLFMGDFNMVGNRADKNRLSSRLVPIRERTIFEAMRSSLNVEDNPRSMGSLKFSWDNLKVDGSRRLARMARLYLFNCPLPMANRQLL
jgi:hypothetical protein